MLFLAAAFIFVWVVITAYLLFMSRRQRTLEDELKTLEELIDEQRVRQ